MINYNFQPYHIHKNSLITYGNNLKTGSQEEFMKIKKYKIKI